MSTQWSARACLAATLVLAGCGDDAVDTSVTGGSGGVGASGSGGLGTAGAGGSGGDDGPVTFQECVELNVLIDLDCSDEKIGHTEWIGAGAGKCLGSLGGASGVARMLFWLDDVDVDGNPSIEGIRIEPVDMSAPQSGNLLELTAPAPSLVSNAMPLASELSWPAVLQPMVFAGGLSFLSADTDDADLAFDRELTLTEIMDGAAVLGTFHMRGGIFTILDGDGEMQTVEDPEGEVMGCFRLPTELHPLDLD